MDDNKFDGIFMNVIQQQNGIDGFFDCVFGFLRRSTDFFIDQKKAEKSIVESCKRNFQKFKLDNKKKVQEEIKKKERQENKKKQHEIEKQKKQKIIQKPKQQKKQENLIETQQNKNLPSAMEEEQINTSGHKPYKYNIFQQQLVLQIFIPKDVIKKQVYVKIDSTHLKIIVRGQILIDGQFQEKINSQQSLWTIEDGQIQDYKGKYINITVEKWKNQWHWWSAAIKGDKQIDTKKINPQSSKLSDLDGETRSTVQKMMQDMRRKQMGLPSTDDQKKNDMLKKFMTQHPQMDFSQCKFN